MLPPATTVFRLVNGEGDGLPGLVVDVWGYFALAQAYDEAWRPHLPLLARALLQDGITSVRALVRGPNGIADGPEQVVGAPLPEEFTAHEDGLAFQVRPGDASLLPGLFPHARPARRRVRELSAGLEVLNLFAHAGGFTVAALAGGATGVDHVDVARKTAPWGARNAAVNGFSPRRCRFVVDDAVAFAERAVRKGRRYGLCVADVPTFGRGATRHRVSASGASHGDTRGLDVVVTRVLDATATGGRMVVGVNAREVGARALWSAVRRAAVPAGVTPVLEERLGPGPDFPGEEAVLEGTDWRVLVVRVLR
jgi:23S rRNA (cytosine1962-C5)-methyltransferase